MTKVGFLLLLPGIEMGCTMEVALKEILNEVSLDETFSHIRFLVDEIGERMAGTEEIGRAARYIKDKLACYGLEARIDNFPIYHSYPKSAALKVLSPETRVIEARPICHIASTLPEGIEGELTYAGVGGYEDYEGLDVRGKVVLADMTWAPPRPEKARIAHEKGAKALIIMNWGPEDNPVIQMGGTKSVWGNPTPEMLKRIPQIPVISVTRAAGVYLRDLCERGGARVWLRAEATREWVIANQPVGVLKVGRDVEEFILVGGHLEAWGGTATCNSSGNGVMLELARVFALHRDKLCRNLVFAFWDGHEVAEAAGSTWFVDKNWDALTKHCVAYINVDNPAIKGTSIPGLTGVTELRGFLEGLVKEMWGERGMWSEAYKGGDNSFFGIGIPYAQFYTRYTPEELKKLNYASLGSALHSEEDKLDKLDEELMNRHLTFLASLIYKLATIPVIPYNLVAIADELSLSLERLKELGGEGLSASVFSGSFDSLSESVARFRDLANRAQELSGQLEGPEETVLLNRTLIHAVRNLSHIMRSEAGRYGQDPYGYSLVGKPIPRLYVPVRKLAELGDGSHEFRLWETQLIRARNRVSDALEDAIEHMELTLAQLARK